MGRWEDGKMGRWEDGIGGGLWDGMAWGRTGAGSTFVHVSPSAKAVDDSRPGQISRPLWPARWKRRVMKSQST